jgi:hypothetical protein
VVEVGHILKDTSIDERNKAGLTYASSSDRWRTRD